jgi:DNA-binding NtrC family response regulator
MHDILFMMTSTQSHNNMDERRKTILVIEDERPLVKVIEAKLERNGFDVVTARTVEQGLGYMQDIQDIDAVWLDHYLLGDQTGIDFVSKLKKAGGQWSRMPIFVVSNTASSTNVQSYMKLGVTSYSVKAERRLDQITESVKSFLKKN